jgi:hypothetical protein
VKRWDCAAAQVVISHAKHDCHASVQLFKVAAMATDVCHAVFSFEVGTAFVITIHFVTSRFLT